MILTKPNINDNLILISKGKSTNISANFEDCVSYFHVQSFSDITLPNISETNCINLDISHAITLNIKCHPEFFFKMYHSESLSECAGM